MLIQKRCGTHNMVHLVSKSQGLNGKPTTNFKKPPAWGILCYRWHKSHNSLKNRQFKFEKFEKFL